MDARTGFAAGGFIVGATFVAVACAVTLSNSAALADAPGVAAGLATIRVSPSSAGTTATPRASAPAVTTPENSAPAPSAAAEVVPAPEPRDVSAAVEAPAVPAAEAPAAPVAPAPAAPDYLTLSKDQIQDEAVRSGSWDQLRAWAVAQGWTEQRIGHWIEMLQGNALSDAGRGSLADSAHNKTPANAGHESGRYWSGVNKTQSPKPPRGD